MAQTSPGRDLPTEGDPMPQTAEHGTLDAAQIRRIDAYWRAATSLSAAKISLLDTPLLREPLRPEHVKPRLLGHWGTTPGINFLYAHMNRAIVERLLAAVVVSRPGRVVAERFANTYHVIK